MRWLGTAHLMLGHACWDTHVGTHMLCKLKKHTQRGSSHHLGSGGGHFQDDDSEQNGSYKVHGAGDEGYLGSCGGLRGVQQNGEARGHIAYQPWV